MKTHTVCLLILIVPMASAWTDDSKIPDEAVVEYGERGLPPEHTRSNTEQPPDDPPPCLLNEPRVREVVQATWEQASLLPEEDLSRRTRARISGYLPKISGGFSKDLGNSWNYRYEPGTARVDQLKNTTGLRWDASIGWDLALFAYNPDELQISRETTTRARERRNLATEVIRIFFARQKIMRRGMPKPGSRFAQLAAEETAALDAWTGGRFQKRWCEVRP
jgi:hypothetical protein